MLWNDIDTSVRNLDSVILFKKVLCFVFLMFHSKICYLTFLSIDILPSFILCALNYCLFKIGCKPSPECLCGFEVESINHYFLHCPLFAAPRSKLLSSAAYIFTHAQVARND
jgi:hypothetical protein